MADPTPQEFKTAMRGFVGACSLITTGAGSERDFMGALAEDAALDGIDARLDVFDLGPLVVTGHGKWVKMGLGGNCGAAWSTKGSAGSGHAPEAESFTACCPVCAGAGGGRQSLMGLAADGTSSAAGTKTSCLGLRPTSPAPVTPSRRFWIRPSMFLMSWWRKKT